MQSISLMANAKERYEKGENVMAFFRERQAAKTNSLDAILASYDLQAGSYIEALENPEYARHIENLTRALAGIFDGFKAESILEAGVGEATTLANVVKRLRKTPKRAGGFDISWSRIAHACKYASQQGVACDLFTGNLLHIPVCDNAFDIVYTMHSIEPNRGSEELILAELYRVARKYLVLLEPSNELGDERMRARIEEHKYCLDLRKKSDGLGFKVIEHKLFEHYDRLENRTSIMIIEKNAPKSSDSLFACPECKNALRTRDSGYFCKSCLTVFPVINKIPCLLRRNGVLAGKFEDFS